MKIISLNIFRGHEFAALIKFFKEQAASTDVFCLQEVLSNPKEDMTALPYEGRANFLEELTRALPEFEVVFAPGQEDFDLTTEYEGQLLMGNALLFKKGLPVVEQGSFFIYNEFNSYQQNLDYETLGHNAVYVTLAGSAIPEAGPRTGLGVEVTIIGLHGNSEPGSKLDSAKRLAQSQKVLDFLTARTGEKIVMGDFNLMPKTKSIKIFEEADYRNLIVEYGVQTTRGSNHRKLSPQYANTPEGYQEFADYTFVSPGIHVDEFTVPDLPLSDHLPLILQFSLLK